MKIEELPILSVSQSWSVVRAAQDRLGFCGCGPFSEGTVWDWVDDVILREERYSDWVSEFHKPPYKAEKPVGFDRQPADWFLFHILTKHEYLEHGGGMPGWLTSEGESLVAAIRTLRAAGWPEIEPDELPDVR